MKPQTVEEVEGLLKAAPSSRDRLLAASVALAKSIHAPQGPGQYVRVPKKEFSDFYWIVRDCEVKP